MFVFEAMKLAEQRGLGFDTVRRLRSDYKLPLPIVKFEDPYIVFTLPRSSKSPIVSLYTESEQEILEILRLNGILQRRQIEEKCGLGGKKVTRILSSLAQKGIVQVLGKKRSTRYAIRDVILGHDSAPSVSKTGIRPGSASESGHDSAPSVSKMGILSGSASELRHDSASSVSKDD